MGLNNGILLNRKLIVSGVLALCSYSALAAPLPIQGHTRPFVQSQQDLGPTDASQPLHIRLWLKPKKSSALTNAVAERMNPNSLNYHNWISQTAEIQKFKATPSDAEVVRSYLRDKGAANIQVDPNGSYVSADMSVADAQSIFKVQLHNFLLSSGPVTANTSDPQLDSEIADKVAYVGGLTTHKKKPFLVRQRDIDTGDFVQARPFDPATAKMGVHDINCFAGVETHTFSTTTGVLTSGNPAASAPTAGTPSPTPTTGTATIVASYTGNRYGSAADAAAPNLAPCGYAPADLQQVYGVTDLVKAGLDGKGQTIVIVDAYGSPTIQADAEAFSAANGLPAPELTIYTPSGPPVTGAWTAAQQGWAGETTLDVEWAHAMAPGAKIALVEATSENDDDLSAAIAFAIDNNLGSVISNSWGGPESEEDPASMALFDILLKTAATQGIAVNVSSGDAGDEMSDGQGGGLGYVDVNYPVSSPFVTGVGGVSLALNSDLSVKFQAGWGTNGLRITDGVTTSALSTAGQNAPLDTPTKLGFLGGSGGGTSRISAKPLFQSGLAGANRMVPDIAYLGDPYTGVELVESSFDAKGNPEPGTLTVQVIGGTSLACPMFSAMWAIANQAHGSSLGQAAPLLYHLPSGAITDIVPVGSSTDVIATIVDSNGTNNLSALQLGMPETVAPFLSAIYNSPVSPFRWDVITFGTDSTLYTAEGWDNVTGLGVPNGVEFIKHFMKK
jgi:subtilase family serine protease